MKKLSLLVAALLLAATYTKSQEKQDCNPLTQETQEILREHGEKILSNYDDHNYMPDGNNMYWKSFGNYTIFYNDEDGNKKVSEGDGMSITGIITDMYSSPKYTITKNGVKINPSTQAISIMLGNMIMNNTLHEFNSLLGSYCDISPENTNLTLPEDMRRSDIILNYIEAPKIQITENTDSKF